MGKIKTVGVKELKNKLSEYLRDARGGTRVLVADRGTVVAALQEPGLLFPDSVDPTLAAWVDSGAVSFPTAEKAPLPESPVHLPEGTALALLDALRDERAE
jgi:hypothetical protein